MKSDSLSEVISIGNIPSCPDRVSSDRKAYWNKFTRAKTEIPCPGGCGGNATVESPMTVSRDGRTKTVQIAHCLGECRTEVRSRMGKARMVPAQFEILVDEAASSGPESDENELAELLKSALSVSGIRQVQAASQIGCSQSVISKILHGYPIAEKTAEATKEWATKVLSGGMTPCESLHEEEREIQTFYEGEPTVEMIPRKTDMSPYETVIRRLLEEVAQKRLEELAGEAARDVVVRVHLEWADRDGQA